MKPILFNTEMVRAILDRSKTETRRDPFQLQEEFSSMKLKGMEYRRKNTYKSEDYKWKNEKVLTAVFENDSSINYIVPCRYKPGDILYVRETWTQDGDVFRYKAGFYDQNRKWKQSIHMPREAARIFLRVTDVRVERLQDIIDEDIVRDFGFCLDAIHFVGRDALAKPFWDRTIKPADRDRYGWYANPWVWVIEFERISREEAFNVDR